MNMPSVKILQNENAVLRQQVAELRRALSEDLFPPQWLKLTPRELSILCVLLKRKAPISSQTLLDTLYNNSDNVHHTVIESHICKLRKKLKEHGVSIHNERYSGYWIGEADKAVIRKLAEEALR